MKRARRLCADPVFIAAACAALPALWLLAAVTPMQFTLRVPEARVLLWMVIAAPVLEEIVFRAGLQDLVASRWAGPARWHIGPVSLANLVTALIFCLLHLIRRPSAWALATFVPALMFGLVYERRRQLAAPILLHGFYNLAYLVFLHSD